MVNIRLDVVTNRTRQIQAEFHDALADALDDVAEACLQEANTTVPLEEGILSDSGFVETDSSALESQAAYSTPYAVRQHEETDLRHDPGRRDHWLEQTVYENVGRYEAHIAGKVQAAAD